MAFESSLRSGLSFFPCMPEGVLCALDRATPTLEQRHRFLRQWMIHVRQVTRASLQDSVKADLEGSEKKNRKDQITSCISPPSCTQTRGPRGLMANYPA